MNFAWKISGEAGFGITTVGLAFSKICTRHDLQIFDYAEFPSLIRGGTTSYEISISNERIGTLKQYLDMLVCLRQDAFDQNKDRLTPHTIVLYDQDTVSVQGEFIQIPIPYREIRSRHKASQVMVNTISLGATIAILDWDLSSLESLLREEFGRKGEDVITHNYTLAKEGWDKAKQVIATVPELASRIADSLAQYPHITTHRQSTAMRTSLILSGNEAFALGSVVADCRAYYAYPMSPSSSVLTVLAAWAKDTGMIVRHVEDEIGVINEALGSSYVGIRSAVGTSGGGFALMVEAISYAGVAELPLVVYLAQRPGPATGLPTWTGQGDLLFAVHAGHGEFPKIVLAAGDAEELLMLSAEAYNLADVYQVPVIVISDKYLAESHLSIPRSSFDTLVSRYEVRRGKITSQTTQERYLRYQDTQDGISEYLIPGVQQGPYWQANSYEHLEDTHTTEDASEVIRQVNKRARKMDTYLTSGDYKAPQVIGDIEHASVIFVSYGSNKAPIIAAQEILGGVGVQSAYIHFTHLYPMKAEMIRPLFNRTGRYIFVENAHDGQFAKLIRQECAIDIENTLLRYDGRPHLAHEIASSVQHMIR